jgi:hypothetical protein
MTGNKIVKYVGLAFLPIILVFILAGIWAWLGFYGLFIFIAILVIIIIISAGRRHRKRYRDLVLPFGKS